MDRTKDVAYLKASKERLQKIALKKIDTTMIGAISILEQAFEPLIGDCSTAEQIRYRDEFEAARSRILDNGNNQKRNLTEEFKQYTIHWEQYTIVMPVKPRNLGGNNG